MAQNRETGFKIHLNHGPDKHVLYLRDPEPGETLSVAHLTHQVETLTRVPVDKQRLIFKGKSLTKPEVSLADIGVRNGSRVMLIGRKVNLEDDANMKQMAEVEAELLKLEKKLGDITSEQDGIEKGYVSSTHQGETLTKLTRHVTACSEGLLKLLERLDALVLADSAAEIRARRKSLVNKIQDCLGRCDNTKKRLDELSSRTSST